MHNYILLKKCWQYKNVQSKTKASLPHVQQHFEGSPLHLVCTSFLSSVQILGDCKYWDAIEEVSLNAFLEPLKNASPSLFFSLHNSGLL